MNVVSVIIPAYDAEATLGRTLQALAAQDLDDMFEVIVVDDGSRDATAAIGAGGGDLVRVIRQSGNLGPGPARNAGARVATSAILAFTDADCFPQADWLRNGLKAMRDADLVQGAVLADPGAPRHPLDRTIEVTAETGLYETASLFVSRELFERLGGFEDWLGPVIGKPLAEDLWLGWRARRAGAATAFSAGALVHHEVFRRGLRGFLEERRRLVHFPRIAAKVPELERSLFFARWFLSPRSAAFDLALFGAATSALVRSKLPLAAAIPYSLLVVERAAPWRRHAPLAAAATLAGDAVTCGALAVGSVRARKVLL